MPFLPRERRIFWSGLLGLALAGSPAHAYSSGPPDGHAGEPPAFTSCRECHGENVGDGGIAISELPPQGYEPGHRYSLAIELFDPGQGRWGFELTALIDATLSQAGTFIVTDPVRTQLSNHPASDPDYLKQTAQGIWDGSPGPVTWNFDWQSPASGSITFYAAGNAANGNGSPSGDFIYLVQRPLMSVTAIGDQAAPVALRIAGPSYPNPVPSGAETLLQFTLERPGRVVAKVFDSNGRFIAEPLAGDLGMGPHVVPWDAHSANGLRVPRGAYFIVLQTAGHRLPARVVVE